MQTFTLLQLLCMRMREGDCDSYQSARGRITCNQSDTVYFTRPYTVITHDLQPKEISLTNAYYII